MTVRDLVEKINNINKLIEDITFDKTYDIDLVMEYLEEYRISLLDIKVR